MKKVFILLSIVALGLLINTSLKAQLMMLNIPGTCKNWSEEIYKTVSEKNPDSNISIAISYYDYNSGSKNENVKISWNEKTFIVDDVSFNLTSTEFVKDGKIFEVDNSYFKKLEAIRNYIYKAYKKGIYNPDFKG
ncbi:TPA: hypothetical protein DCZ15_04125 [Candidatus Falkowbacteria bacterium]|nr:MAG: hypothetical protein UV95_C0001G0345 [Candidatus Falkowbacteria bacterium GW2011_GWF2_43_32]HBA37027.1 hypothetical protein [Candidatus Falkowbacteria bacterium]